MQNTNLSSFLIFSFILIEEIHLIFKYQIIQLPQIILQQQNSMINTILHLNLHKQLLLKCYKSSKKIVYRSENPQAADFSSIFLLDVNHNHLVNEISGLLKQEYLVPYQKDSKTATGILYGAHARPLICLPVQPLGKKAKPISVHFLIDTGAPTSFISEQALIAIFGVTKLALIQSPGVNKACRKSINRTLVGDKSIRSQLFKKSRISLQLRL